LGKPVLASVISRVDTIGIPSSDTARSREFYVDTLGLRPDEHPLALHKPHASYKEKPE
jgi:catechol 2,3-dioxygenase-like lactoylglutathione lyase family enzyme